MLVRQPDLFKKAGRLDLGRLARQATHTNRRLDDVFHDGHVRPQVEMLEHHSDVAAHLFCRQAHRLGPRGIADHPILHQDRTVAGCFKQGETTQKSGLSRPRRADDADNLPLVHGDAHAVQNPRVAEILTQPIRPDQRHSGNCRSIAVHPPSTMVIPFVTVMILPSFCLHAGIWHIKKAMCQLGKFMVWM